MATRKRKSGKNPAATPTAAPSQPRPAATAAAPAPVAEPITQPVTQAASAPAANAPSPSSTAQSSPNTPQTAPRRRWPRFLAAAAIVLALGLGALAWWAHQPQSLPWLVHSLIPRLLPAGQSLHANHVSGSLRYGGRIENLTWTGTRGERLVAHSVDLPWDLWPLLRSRHVAFDDIHISRIDFTPSTEPAPASEPATPPSHARLPVTIKLPLRVDALHWGPSPEHSAHNLQAQYDFDGNTHTLAVPSLHWADALWRLDAQLGAAAPMPLSARMTATQQTAELPENQPNSHKNNVLNPQKSPKHAQTPSTQKATLGRGLPTSAHGTAAASPLTLLAQLNGPVGDATGIVTLEAQLARTDNQNPQQNQKQNTPAVAHARIQPWGAQPLLDALVQFNALNLAEFLPSAPRTALHGQVKAGPVSTANNDKTPEKSTDFTQTPWALELDLRNTAAAHLSRAGLPITRVAAQLHFDARGQWDLPLLRVEPLAGAGSAAQSVIEATARAHALTHELAAEVHLHDFNPAAISAAAPARRITAQLRTQGQLAAMAALPAGFGTEQNSENSNKNKELANNLQFHINWNATGVAAKPALHAKNQQQNNIQAQIDQALVALSLIDRLHTQGQWRQNAAEHLANVEKLQLHAQNAQLNSQNIQLELKQKSPLSSENPNNSPDADLAPIIETHFRAQKTDLTAPGLTAQLAGHIAPNAGAGRLEVGLNDLAATQAWAQHLQAFLQPFLSEKSPQQNAALNNDFNVAAIFNGLEKLNQNHPDIFPAEYQTWIKTLNPAQPSALPAPVPAQLSGQASARLQWSGGWQPWLSAAAQNGQRTGSGTAHIALDLDAPALAHRAGAQTQTLRNLALHVEGTPAGLKTQFKTQAQIATAAADAVTSANTPLSIAPSHTGNAPQATPKSAAKNTPPARSSQATAARSSSRQPSPRQSATRSNAAAVHAAPAPLSPAPAEMAQVANVASEAAPLPDARAQSAEQQSAVADAASPLRPAPAPVRVAPRLASDIRVHRPAPAEQNAAPSVEGHVPPSPPDARPANATPLDRADPRFSVGAAIAAAPDASALILPAPTSAQNAVFTPRALDAQTTPIAPNHASGTLTKTPQASAQTSAPSALSTARALEGKPSQITKSLSPTPARAAVQHFEIALAAQARPTDAHGAASARAWQADIQSLNASWQPSAHAPRWSATLAQPLTLAWHTQPHTRIRASAGHIDLRVEATDATAARSPANAKTDNPTSAQNAPFAPRALDEKTTQSSSKSPSAAPTGALFLRWQDSTVEIRPAAQTDASDAGDVVWPATLAVRSAGEVRGVSLAWLPMLLSVVDPAAAHTAPVEGDLMLAAHWTLDTTAAHARNWRVHAGVERTSGDARLRLPEGVNALGEDDAEGGSLLIVSSGLAPRARGQKVRAATGEHTQSGQGTQRTRLGEPVATLPMGIEDLQASVTLEGGRLSAHARFVAQQTGVIQSTFASDLSARAVGLVWAGDAPIVGGIHVDLPTLGKLGRLSPPGWRVQGAATLQAAILGTRAAPELRGTLEADELALRSQLQGVALERGRLRVRFDGASVTVEDFTLHGSAGGGGAHILGPAGNRTSAPKDGGHLQIRGTIALPHAAGAGFDAPPAMRLQAQLQSLQLLARADRQLSLDGTLEATTDAAGRLQLSGDLHTTRAAFILADNSAPTLNEDIRIVHASVAATSAAPPAPSDAATEASDPLGFADVDVRIHLGDDFAIRAMGLTTRLQGELRLQNGPKLTGEIRTEAGRYRAWGQALDIENGLIVFGDPLTEPVLDILAIRPNLPERVGVKVTGTASQPRVVLYSANVMSDAEKLSWIALGRDPAQGGAEMAMLQQAALALLSGGGSGESFAGKLGLDELGMKMPNTDSGETAAITVGKRLGKNLYVAYEQSLNGTIGALSILYDLSSRLTLRAQTSAAQSAIDLIYTHRRD